MVQLKTVISEKSKRLATQNSSASTNKRPQQSIKKYCTEKVSIIFFALPFQSLRVNLKVVVL